MEKFKFAKKNKWKNLPKRSGVYCFKDKKGKILYIGKAGNLRNRVKNHFSKQTFRDNLFINKVEKVGSIKTDSEITALILEANLIKKYQPKFNVVWQDDKNYFYVGVTKEDYPRVFITHQPFQKFKVQGLKFKVNYVGPFVDGKALKNTLNVLRKIFPYRNCRILQKHPCLWYQLERCPAPCLLQSNLAKEIPNFKNKIKKEVKKNTKNLIKVLKGKKILVLKNLKKEMKRATILQDFERAAKIRDQTFALEKVLKNAKIFEPEILSKKPTWSEVKKRLKEILKIKKDISRIEAYDISNIQGKLATGSMVVFENGFPNKKEYRKFKIKITGQPNDIAMIREVLFRRFNHPEWDFPDLILIDGGIAQLNAALNVKCQMSNVKCVILALAKKKNELYIEGERKPIFLDSLPNSLKFVILQLRDEAHRFAISYHRKLRKLDLFRK